MGKMADRCYLQRRVLNRSKGPAVWALRAQTDKKEYCEVMRKVRACVRFPILSILPRGQCSGG